MCRGRCSCGSSQPWIPWIPISFIEASSRALMISADVPFVGFEGQPLSTLPACAAGPHPAVPMLSLRGCRAVGTGLSRNSTVLLWCLPLSPPALPKQRHGESVLGVYLKTQCWCIVILSPVTGEEESARTLLLGDSSPHRRVGWAC